MHNAAPKHATRKAVAFRLNTLLLILTAVCIVFLVVGLIRNKGL